MKLRNAGLLMVVLAALSSCDRSREQAAVAQGGSNDPWSKQEPRQDPLPRPLFWSIEKDGHTSYLFGTMHVGVDPHTRIPKLVWDKLDAAKVFAMEIDPTKMSGIDLTRKDGTTLRDELGDTYWSKLEDALGASTAKAMLKLKAMVPATALSMRGLPETPAMDTAMHDRAAKQGKQLVYLETLELELAELENWMNARMLKDILDDLPGTERRSKDMLAAYLAGDEAKMQAVQDSERADWLAKGRPAAEYDAGMERLLYARNASWLPPIEKLHAAGGGFIAVGAAHAIGPRSVLDLLAEKGYTITRLAP